MCLVLLYTMSSHSNCNYSVPSWHKLGEEEKENSSCVLVHIVVKGLNKEIQAKM